MSPRTAHASLSPETGTRLSFGAPHANLPLQTAQPPATDPALERDLAYELGVQAEAAGDHVRAAAAHERAYRLTAPTETGPRLLFLRSSVAARLRADDGSPDTRVQLCRAEQLLRDYLADPRAPAGPTDERTSLARIEQRLQTPGPDCKTLLGDPTPPPQPTPGPAQSPTTPTPTPAQSTVSPTPTSTPAPAQSTDSPSPPRTPPPAARTLRISGLVGLGLGLGGVALLAGGAVMGRRANERGQLLCHLLQAGCNAFDPELRQVARDGRRGDALIRAGAAVAGLGLLAGVVLLVVGERLRRRARLAHAPVLHPTLAPGHAGLGLSGRF